MLFEGSVFLKKDSFRVEEIKSKYDKVVVSEFGYFGVVDQKGSKAITNSYFGAFFSGLLTKAPEFLSSLSTENSGAYFLSVLAGEIASNCIGVSAVYDFHKGELLLARELFGRVPFYYTVVPDSAILFSTSFASLASNNSVRSFSKANVQRVVSYASSFRDGTSFYETDTFLTNIKAVLPGHIARVTFDQITSTPFYKFKPSKWSHLTSVGEFGEEFKSCFLNAVRTSDKGPEERFASHLSGGLDSSSISTALRFLFPDRSLLTLYNKSNTIDTDENRYALAAAAAIGSDHHEILQSNDHFNLLTKYVQTSWLPPSALLSPSGTWSLMKFARSYGCDTIFNGHAGDSIVGTGFEIIERSFHNGQWDLFKSLLRKRARYFANASQYRHWDKLSSEKRFDIVLQNFLYRQLSSKLLHGSLKDFWQFYGIISANFKVSRSFFINRGFKGLLNRARKREGNGTVSILHDHLLSQYKALSTPISLLAENEDRPEFQESIIDVFNKQAILSNEQQFVISTDLGIVNSSPFYNKELFELCMAVPDEIKLGDGIGRAHFREGMKGLLVEEVRNRSSKTPIRSHGQDLTALMYNQAKELLYDSKIVWEFVDRKKFDRQVSMLMDDRIPYYKKIETRFHVSRIIALVSWLETAIVVNG